VIVATKVYDFFKVQKYRRKKLKENFNACFAPQFLLFAGTFINVYKTKKPK